MSSLLVVGKQGASQALIAPTSLVIAGPNPWTDITAPRTPAGVAMGADPTGVASANAALTAADAVGGHIFLPAGTYRVSANLTLNNDLILSSGAKFSVDPAVVLTINGQIQAGLRQIFTGSGTVSLGGATLQRVYPQWWGATADGVDTTATVQKAITATPSGRVLYFAPTGSYYNITAALNVTSSITLLGENSELRMATTAALLLNVQADNVLIKRLKLTGPQFATQNYSEKAINFVGTSAASRRNGLKIEDCEISSFGGYGVFCRYAYNIRVERSNIHDIYNTAVMIQSTSYGFVLDNVIDNVVGTGSVYGVSLTSQEVDLTSDPVTTHIQVSRNRISNIPNWDAIGTHGGEDCDFSHNIINNCAVVCDVGAIQGTGQVFLKGPKRIRVIGNIGNSGKTDGDISHGINITGAYQSPNVVDYAEDCVCIGNSLTGYGPADSNTPNTLDGAYYFHTTKGLIFDGNTATDPGINGVSIYHDNVGFVCTSNHFAGPWTNIAAGAAYAIRVRGNYNSGVISNNTSDAGSHTVGGGGGVVAVATVAIRVENPGSNANDIQVGLNPTTYATVLEDPGFKARALFPARTSFTAAGSSVNDVTQDALRIQPSANPATYYRGLAIYRLTADTVPIFYSDDNGQLNVNGRLQADNSYFNIRTRGVAADTGGDSDVRFYDGDTAIAGHVRSAGSVVAGSRYFGMLAGVDRDANRLPIRLWTLDNTGTLQNAIFIQADQEAGKAGAVVINGSTVVTSSVFEVRSTTRGMLFPRMTAAQRGAIATPATGLTIYNTDNNRFEYYYSAAWVSLAKVNDTLITEDYLTARFDGGDAPVAAGYVAAITVPYACTVTGWYVIADQTGNIQVDVRRSSYANYQPGTHPVVGDSVAGTDKPKLVAAYKNTSTALTGWTTTLAAGDVLYFYTDSADTLLWAQIVLLVTKT